MGALGDAGPEATLDALLAGLDDEEGLNDDVVLLCLERDPGTAEPYPTRLVAAAA